MSRDKHSSRVSNRLRRSFWIGIAALALLWALAAFEVVDYLSGTGQSTEAQRHGGSEITIGSRKDASGNIEILIIDNGKLDEKIELATLYEPFVVSGNIANRDTRGGLGLGLPLTRKLVELHGGEFEVIAAAHHTSAVIRLPAWRVKAAQSD